ncbi:hypothetical protein ACLOJK_019544 [Asimina triloba]
MEKSITILQAIPRQRELEAEVAEQPTQAASDNFNIIGDGLDNGYKWHAGYIEFLGMCLLDPHVVKKKGRTAKRAKGPLEAPHSWTGVLGGWFSAMRLDWNAVLFHDILKNFEPRRNVTAYHDSKYFEPTPSMTAYHDISKDFQPRPSSLPLQAIQLNPQRVFTTLSQTPWLLAKLKDKVKK